MGRLPISVVILTRNSQATIGECLESVRKNEPREILVIDGNSTDATLEIARGYTSKIYCDEGKGISYARQLGAEMATAEYIAYVDSDVVLPAGALRRMLEEMEQEGFAAICAQQLSGNKGWPGTGAKGHPQVTEVIDTRSTIFRREVLLKYGFDPSTPNCDVLDISYKLLRHGYRFGLSTVRVWHTPSAERRGLYWIGVAAAEFLWKYRREGAALKYGLAKGLGMPFYMMALSLSRGNVTGLRYLGAAAIEMAGFLRGVAWCLGRSVKPGWRSVER